MDLSHWEASLITAVACFSIFKLLFSMIGWFSVIGKDDTVHLQRLQEICHSIHGKTFPELTHAFVVRLSEKLRSLEEGKDPAEPVPANVPEADPADEPADIPLSALGCVVAMGLLVALLFAIPVMVAQSAPILALIMGFALWEAWQLNAFVQVPVEGPFQVSADSSAERPPGV